MFRSPIPLLFVGAACLTFAGTPSTNQTKKNAASSNLTGYSGWMPITMIRNKLIPWIGHSRDFNDIRYEYRWKAERVVNDDLCTIELRIADDVEGTETLPFVDVQYSNPYSHGHAHGIIQENVRVGAGKEHAFLTAKDCAEVEIVAWGKAEDLPRMRGAPSSK